LDSWLGYCSGRDSSVPSRRSSRRLGSSTSLVLRPHHVSTFLRLRHEGQFGSTFCRTHDVGSPGRMLPRAWLVLFCHLLLRLRPSVCFPVDVVESFWVHWNFLMSVSSGGLFVLVEARFTLYVTVPAGRLLDSAGGKECDEPITLICPPRCRVLLGGRRQH
jgi:hypothetical protein